MEATQKNKISDRDKADECLKIFEEAIKAANTIGPGGVCVGEIRPGIIQVEVSFDELGLKCEENLDPIIPIIEMVQQDLSAKGNVMVRFFSQDLQARSILIRRFKKASRNTHGFRSPLGP
jgi:hypothetical protein